MGLVSDVARPSRAGWLLLGAVTLVAAVLRVEGLKHGFTPDEIANAVPGAWWDVLTDPENGVNPPLWRLGFTAFLPDVQKIHAARQVAYVCGVLLVPAVAALTWLISRGHGMASLGVAMLVAAHPLAIRVSAVHRAYALTTLLLVLHLIALVVWLDREDDRRWWARWVVLTALPLPWLHYFLVPVLLGVGVLAALCVPQARRLVALYVPAGLAWAPLAWFVVQEPARRVAHLEPVSQTLAKIGGLGLQPPAGWLSTVGRAAGGLGLGPWTGQAWMSGVVALIVLGPLVYLPRLRPARRVLMIGAVTCGLAVVGLAQVQYVRAPTVVYVLAFVGPLAGALVADSGRRSVQLVLGLGLAWVLGGALPRLVQEERARLPGQDGLRVAAGYLVRQEAWMTGRPVFVHPAYASGWLYTHVTGSHPSRYRHLARCAEGEGCFDVGGRTWSSWASGSPVPDGWVLSFDEVVPEALQASCQLAREEPGLRVFSCAPQAGGMVPSSADR